jgi:hypothetical protein
MLDVVRAMLDGRGPSFEESGMSRREWDELMTMLGRPS